MADYYEMEEEIPISLDLACTKLSETTDWKILFKNKTKDEAEFLFLTGMFSGAGMFGLFQDGARKSILFVKLRSKGRDSTQARVICGGTERWFGFDYGRHQNNVDTILELLRR